MDSSYQFFNPQNYQHFVQAGVSVQDALGDDGKHAGSSGLHHQEVLDPSTFNFSSPYEAFRFDPMSITTPDIQDMSISIPPTEAQSPLTPTAGLDSAHPFRSNSVNGIERRSSSEEKEPAAINKRKAQNRAAQRAFRERKERHVKDLETKLSVLENSTTSLATDNQRLKLALQRAMTENEMLRATSTSTWKRRRSSNMSFSQLGIKGFAAQVDEGSEGESSADEDASPPDLRPKRGSVKAARDADRMDKRMKDAAPAGEMLSSNALWDFIVEHPLVRSGQVDIADACDRLRRLAKPGNQGPVFYEGQVREAIESSRKGGGDALI